jgi:hypothetical protein
LAIWSHVELSIGELTCTHGRGCRGNSSAGKSQAGELVHDGIHGEIVVLGGRSRTLREARSMTLGIMVCASLLMSVHACLGTIGKSSICGVGRLLVRHGNLQHRSSACAKQIRPEELKLVRRKKGDTGRKFQSIGFSEWKK